MSHGRSEVSFTNSYGKKIFVAYMRRDFSCHSDCGAPWNVLGWINLDPGETEVRANPTKNQWFYYYAEAVDGAFWAGPFVANVSDEKFQKCSCFGVHVSHGPQPYYDVGMRVLDTVASSGVNFIA
jgi:Protein of unknown function (DUF1036)